ncbi:MAG: D-aminoacyl-tRNA deacylase [Candidatus Omnitrophota bacterium]
MKAVLQRVKEAKVVVAGEIVGSIGRGVLILLGVEKNDTEIDMEAMVKKIAQLRIFPSPEGGRMDLTAVEVNGEYLVVSQFTLAADLTKGNRPSFDNAAPPETAEKLYELFVAHLKKTGGCRVATGKFRAMMDVALVNDGPVTFVL